MQHQKLVIVATFDNSAVAHIAKSNLESAGIRCFLDGEHHVSMDWLISNAVGGIKLVVDENDRETAAEILSQNNEDELQDVDYGDNREIDDTINCPACQSVETYDDRWHRKSVFLTILFLGFPIPFTSKVQKCMDCGLRWLPE